MPLEIPQYELHLRGAGRDESVWLPLPLFRGRILSPLLDKEFSIGIRIDTGADVSVIPEKMRNALRLVPDGSIGSVVCRGLDQEHQDPEPIYRADFSIPDADFPDLVNVPVIARNIPYAVLGVFGCLQERVITFNLKGRRLTIG